MIQFWISVLGNTASMAVENPVRLSVQEMKMLYLAMMDITKKWTGRRQDWSLIHAQLAVFFADRMPD